MREATHHVVLVHALDDDVDPPPAGLPRDACRHVLRIARLRAIEDRKRPLLLLLQLLFLLVRLLFDPVVLLAYRHGCFVVMKR